MHLPLHIIDAFTADRFQGNPAAVVPLEGWLPDATLQAIASENNLSETAFLVWDAARQAVAIRWFSPIKEIAFCGHATLASAFVLFEERPAETTLAFWAPAVGVVQAHRTGAGRIRMTFPRRDAEPVAAPPAGLVEGLSLPAERYLVNAQAYIAVYATEAEVHAVQPDLRRLASLGPRDVAVTAPADPGSGRDFVSRYFWPANGGDEDPVTGSIHAALAPWWAARTGRSELVAHQASRRSGTLYCAVRDDAVDVSGDCVRYLRGTITV